MLTLPFTVQGNTAAIDSASVRLVNLQGLRPGYGEILNLVAVFSLLQY